MDVFKLKSIKTYIEIDAQILKLYNEPSIKMIKKKNKKNLDNKKNKQNKYKNKN